MSGLLDPWAWRSDMDAPQPQPRRQDFLREGPAPTGAQRLFDTIYGWLGNKPENRAPADQLSKLFDVGTLGMATGAYDGAQELAMTGRPASLAMALMPGAKVAARAAKAVDKAATETVQGIRAYHGSPHDFDRFDMSKIGTGEGSQAYGPGLYFAENEGVAKSYRDALADIKVGGQPPDLKQPDHWMAMALDAAHGDKAKAVADLRRDLRSQFPDNRPAIEDAIRRIEGGNIPSQLPQVSDRGRMYEVRINADPEHFLDWDKPLSQQPEAARRVLEREMQSSLDPTRDQMRALMGDAPIPKLDPNVATPHDVIKNRRAPGRIEDALKAEGIPGIKYLDQGSRDAGAGSRNYVVFDDALISIVRKYMAAGMSLSAAVAAAQGDRQNWPKGLLEQ